MARAPVSKSAETCSIQFCSVLPCIVLSTEFRFGVLPSATSYHLLLLNWVAKW